MNQNLKTGLVTLVAVLGVCGPLAVYGKWLLGEARAAGAETAAEAVRVSSSAAAELARHEADSGQVHLQLKGDMREVQLDTRALYKAVMSGERQARLERGPTIAFDGGP